MKACYICQKTSLNGGGYSNRTRATQFNPTGKRRRQVNLQRGALASGLRVMICTKCLKANKHLVTN